MPVRPTRQQALAWALLGGLPLLVLTTDGRPVLLSGSIAEAAAFPATFAPGPTITTVPAMVPERISDARVRYAAMPEQQPEERLSDARLSADASSPVPPSERVSDARVLALGSPATPRSAHAETRRPFASLVTAALKDETAALTGLVGDAGSLPLHVPGSGTDGD